MSSDGFDEAETLPVHNEAVAPDDRVMSGTVETNPSEEAALPDDVSGKATDIEFTVPMQPSKGQTAAAEVTMRDQAATPVSPSPLSINKVKSRREMLDQHAQEIVQELNNKRAQDSQMLEDFRAVLQLHTDRVIEQTQENLFKMYERQSTIAQEKIQELNETLGRIEQLESEMQDFKKALGMLYVDMSEK